MAILSTKRFRHWLFSTLCKNTFACYRNTETKARLGINSGNSFLNRNESKIQRTLYKHDDIFAVLKHQNNRHFRFSLAFFFFIFFFLQINCLHDNYSRYSYLHYLQINYLHFLRDSYLHNLQKQRLITNQCLPY